LACAAGDERPTTLPFLTTPFALISPCPLTSPFASRANS
jgi:hypothetical protein